MLIVLFEPFVCNFEVEVSVGKITARGRDLICGSFVASMAAESTFSLPTLFSFIIKSSNESYVVKNG